MFNCDFSFTRLFKFIYSSLQIRWLKYDDFYYDLSYLGVVLELKQEKVLSSWAQKEDMLCSA